MNRASRVGLAAALMVAAPVLVGVGYSTLAALDLAGAGGSGSASLHRLLRVAGDGAVWRGTLWSLWIASASTFLASAVAVLLAVAFRGTGAMDRLGRRLTILPLPVPHVVAGVMGVLILGQSGLLSRVGHAAGLISGPAGMPALVYDPWGAGLILTLVWKEVPFLALIAFSVLASGGSDLEEAARTLGASRWQILRRVTLPTLVHGLLPASVAVFAFAAGSYELAVLLAPSDPLALPLQTMERYTDSALSRRGDAFVLALIALAIAAVAVAVHEALRSRHPADAL